MDVVKTIGAVALALAAAATSALAAEPVSRFDLTCSGTERDLLSGRASPFAEVISVDLKARRLCLATFCAGLTKVTRGQLEYHCRMSRTAFCDQPSPNARGAVPLSSAGPWTHGDDLVFDRASGAYSRLAWGRVGDPASRPYRTEYQGHCAARPARGPLFATGEG